MRLTFIACAVAFWAASAAGVHAAESIHAKVGADLAATQADAAACVAEARTGRTQSGSLVHVPGGGVAASAGAALATGILEGIAQGRAQNAHVDRCMRRLGYAKLTLTPAEAAAFSAVRTEQDRRAWVEAWLKDDRQEARIRVALTPKVPALPSAPPDEAFAIHGLRLLPETIALAPGPVRWGKPVLTAKAVYRGAATVAEPLELGGMLKARLEKGATLHVVDTRVGADTVESSHWCGPVTHGTVWGKRVTRAACVQSLPEGYAWSLWAETPRPLLTQSSMAPMTGIASGELRLEPAPPDTTPRAVELRLAGLTSSDLTLELVVSDGPKPLAIWRRTVAMGADGRAVAPFWTQQLVLTRTGQGAVTAVLQAGDGRSLASADPANLQR